MRTRTLLIVAALFFIAVQAVVMANDQPAGLNYVLRPGILDEANFPPPGAPPHRYGGMLYGSDAGRLYLATDAGWKRISLDP